MTITFSSFLYFFNVQSILIFASIFLFTCFSFYFKLKCVLFMLIVVVVVFLTTFYSWYIGGRGGQ